MYEDPPRRKPPSIGELLMRLTMQQDATRVAPRYAPAPYEEKIRASEVPQLGGIPLAAARRALRPSTRFSESPAVQFGSALMKLTGLSDPLSAIEGPARAMGIVGKVGKVDDVPGLRSFGSQSLPMDVQRTAVGDGIRRGQGDLRVGSSAVVSRGKLFTGDNHPAAYAKAVAAQLGINVDEIQDGTALSDLVDDLIDNSDEGFLMGRKLRSRNGLPLSNPKGLEYDAEQLLEALENPTKATSGPASGGYGTALMKATSPSASPLSGTRVLDEAPLPMDQASRMARAREQGFDTSQPLYKGMPSKDWQTGEPITSIQSRGSNHLGGGYAGFLTDDPAVASRFAEGIAGNDPTQASVFPLVVRKGNAVEIDMGGRHAGAAQFADVARSQGGFDQMDALTKALADESIETVILKNTADEGTVVIPKQSANIRGKFAAFDPKNIGKANLLGGLAGTGLGAALMAQTYQKRER